MRLIAFILFLGFGFSGSIDAGEKEALAEEAALNWLSLLDTENYQESWETAANIFRQQVSPEQWQQAISKVRKPFGLVRSRELMSQTYTTSLPGAPDGEYVVLQFQTEFDNKSMAVETVTPMLDGDEWLVTGYFVR